MVISGLFFNIFELQIPHLTWIHPIVINAHQHEVENLLDVQNLIDILEESLDFKT